MVGVRFAGLDGVTLESAKIASVLEQAGHDVVWFAGELGETFTPGRVEPEAHFLTVANQDLNSRCFGVTQRTAGASSMLVDAADRLTEALGSFLDDFEADAVMTQNALAIPLQLPLGLAITRVVDERSMPTVAHGHDFAWERDRFHPNGVADVLKAAFPPPGPEYGHVVINSFQQEELVRRIGRESVLLPNVMDFETGPEPTDAPAFRTHAGLNPKDVLLVQPTRIIPRKNVEASIALAARLGDVRLVITHPEQDEGGTYWPQVQRRAEEFNVDLRLVPVGGLGGPSLGDAYAAADLILYPTLIEGFGNALVEAMFYRRPVLVNRYPVYERDIEPTGVQAIEMDGDLTREVVARVEAWLADPSLWEEAVETNYQVGLRHFSYGVVRNRILPLFEA